MKSKDQATLITVSKSFKKIRLYLLIENEKKKALRIFFCKLKETCDEWGIKNKYEQN